MGLVSVIVFGLVALLFAAVFAIVAVTKIAAFYWFGYVTIVVFGFGAVGCFIAARQCFAHDRRSDVPTALRAALGSVTVLLAVFAVRAAVFAHAGYPLHSGVVFRSVAYMFIVVYALGAAACFMVARQNASPATRVTP